MSLDLKDDTKLIAEYEAYHKNIWPEIIESIQSAGIQILDTYRVSNPLFMIMETKDIFSFKAKQKRMLKIRR